MQNNKTALNCKTFVGTGPLANLISIIIQALSKFYLFCKLCDAPHSFHSESRDNNKGLVQDVIKHYSSKHGVKLKTSDVRSSHFPGGKETFKMNNINNFFKGSQTLGLVLESIIIDDYRVIAAPRCVLSTSPWKWSSAFLCIRQYAIPSGKRLKQILVFIYFISPLS